MSIRDIDPQETQEWLASLGSLLRAEGKDRANYILEALLNEASKKGLTVPSGLTTDYINTIAVADQPAYAGDLEMERKIEAYVRWNAIAMVMRAGKDTNVGGHIASFMCSANLYEMGQNHFWHGQEGNHGGDLIFFQGHSAPGMYARAYLEGRLSEEQLDNFRQEVGGNGLSSYPHPWLMPNFWQFPTVSMGLGPMMAIYQAKFLKYMECRDFLPKNNRKVWAFLGDGEMDEPESRGQLSIASLNQLDNLVFVVSCNLQRLDGPVRGNTKIIQELEGVFRGAGWNVIKLMWSSEWDKLFARDTEGLLKRRMMEVVDGDYQTYKSKDGAYIREHLFNTPELKALVADISDEELFSYRRGAHDPLKVYAAFKKASESDKPTVILAHGVKGYGMGGNAESQNVAHQSKKMGVEQLKALRDRYQLPLNDEQVEHLEYLKFADGSPEQQYLLARRQALEGFVPSRRAKSEALQLPDFSIYNTITTATKEGREISTTMAFVRALTALMKDPNIGKRIVPIVPDESRTFGMEGMFRQFGIWSPLGQRYTPEDAKQLSYYKESTDGQLIQAGINEGGAICDWIAAATSYSVHNQPMIPFFIYYSMFGFQRFGDFAWAAGDLRARGFLLGGTAGRTTLNGEGLQHEDGHSHVLASTIPNCITYDPTFGYEVAVIVQEGLRRMYVEQEDVFYYLTVLNENYAHPDMPAGCEEGILKGLYQIGSHDGKERLQLMGSGSILMEVIEGAKLLAQDFGIASDVWSAPSFNELARDGAQVERYNRLHPLAEPKQSHLEKVLKDKAGTIIVATDYMRSYVEQVRAYLPDNREMIVLGTDGFGRSDTREALRSHFEVNRYHVVVAGLTALAKQGKVKKETIAEAIKKYGIETESAYPLYC